MKTFPALASALLLAVALPLAALAQITIATPAAGTWGSIRSQDSRNSGSTAWGQIFVAPDATHTQIDRFELRMGSFPGYTPADFTTYLAQWDAGPQRTVGAPLWTSSLQSGASLSNYTLGGNAVSFETGGVNLTAGQTYIILALAAAQPLSDPMKATALGVTYPLPSTYAGGSFVEFYADATALSYATLSTTSLYTDGGRDLAFGATFSESGLSAVPEPAAPAAVFALALAAGLFVLRRRHLRPTTANASSADRTTSSHAFP